MGIAMLVTIAAILVGLVAIGIIGAIRIRESGQPVYRVTVPDPDEPHASI